MDERIAQLQIKIKELSEWADELKKVQFTLPLRVLTKILVNTDIPYWTGKAQSIITPDIWIEVAVNSKLYWIAGKLN